MNRKETLTRDDRTNLSLLLILIILIAIVPLLVLSAGVASEQKEWLLSVTLIATPLVTFFGFILLEENLKVVDTTVGVLRTALTVSIITEYFILLAVTIFLAGQADQFPLQEQLVNSFTTIVGVVIAFYFGASAYTQVASKRS